MEECASASCRNVPRFIEIEGGAYFCGDCILKMYE